MKQSLSNIQKQEQRQLLQQHLSAQQVLVVKMLEMPLAQLEDNVLRELDTNPSLEPDYDDREAADMPSETPGKSDEEERREDALNDALDLMARTTGCLTAAMVRKGRWRMGTQCHSSTSSMSR